MKRATEPFFTTKGVGKGTGLGLSMVHGLAAQSGGAMRIRSRVGQGTTVELWLPVSDRIAGDHRPRLSPRRSTARPHGRVLVVDDDPLILSATAAMLEDLGHTVLEAGSGQAALDMLRGRQVDLVITDQAMPGMTGTELARRIRAQWPELPIILASGYAELPNGEEPGLPRLSKPYQQDELAAAIARVLSPGEDSGKVVPFDLARRA